MQKAMSKSKNKDEEKEEEEEEKDAETIWMINITEEEDMVLVQ